MGSGISEAHIRADIHSINGITSGPKFNEKFKLMIIFKLKTSNKFLRGLSKFIPFMETMKYTSDSHLERFEFELLSKSVDIPEEAKVLDVKELNPTEFIGIYRGFKHCAENLKQYRENRRATFLLQQKELLQSENIKYEENKYEPNTTKGENTTPGGEDPTLLEECSICIDNKVELVLPCMHAFCDSCISNWRLKEGSCPICRGQLQDIETLKYNSWNIVETNEIQIDFEAMLSKVVKSVMGLKTNKRYLRRAIRTKKI